MEYVTRIAPTALLKEINASSVEYGFNRTLSDETIDNMEESINIVRPVMPHIEAGLKQHEKFHIRCEVVFAVKDQDEPISAFIDIEGKIFDSMPKYIDLIALRSEIDEKIS